jgi:small subunit ribosomal protein S27Ae
MSQAQKPAPAAAAAAKKTKKRRLRGTMYEVSGSTAKLKNRKCPRCGSVMALHTNPVQRWVCGSCGLTEYAQK